MYIIYPFFDLCVLLNANIGVKFPFLVFDIKDFCAELAQHKDVDADTNWLHLLCKRLNGPWREKLSVSRLNHK